MATATFLSLDFVLLLWVLCFQEQWARETEVCYRREDGGVKYDGELAVSETGQPCVYWSETDVVLAGPDHRNYCRAPRPGDLVPWCYVRTEEGELVERRCDIQHCTVCYTVTGADYRGNQSRPGPGGAPCVPWTDRGTYNGKTVHAENQENRNRGVGEHNYCRNPSTYFSPWCYTGGGETDYRPCHIQDCKAPGYLGCYNDDDGNLIPKAVTPPKWSLTIESCLEHCRLLTRRYAVIRNGQDCYCTDGVTSTAKPLKPSNACGVRCHGNMFQYCGGYKRTVSVFDTNMGRCNISRYGQQGTIYSPNYPGSYPGSADCHWNISVPEDHLIKLRFQLFSMNEASWVGVSDDVGRTSGVRITGQDPVGGYVTSSAAASVHFRARPSQDSAGPRAREDDGMPNGFILLFEAIRRCPTPTIAHGDFDVIRPMTVVSDGSIVAGDTVQFYCDDGYRLTGPERLLCTKNGDFDKDVPKCHIPETIVIVIARTTRRTTPPPLPLTSREGSALDPGTSGTSARSTIARPTALSTTLQSPTRLTTLRTTTPSRRPTTRPLPRPTKTKRPSAPGPDQRTTEPSRERSHERTAPGASVTTQSSVTLPDGKATSIPFTDSRKHPIAQDEVNIVPANTGKAESYSTKTTPVDVPSTWKSTLLTSPSTTGWVPVPVYSTSTSSQQTTSVRKGFPTLSTQSMSRTKHLTTESAKKTFPTTPAEDSRTQQQEVTKDSTKKAHRLGLNIFALIAIAVAALAFLFLLLILVVWSCRRRNHKIKHQKMENYRTEIRAPPTGGTTFENVPMSDMSSSGQQGDSMANGTAGPNPQENADMRDDVDSDIEPEVTYTELDLSMNWDAPVRRTQPETVYAQIRPPPDKTGATYAV
ncbi:Kremen protein 1 [Branchiostoma belcheri]|nr:Kremen protein 1 [Branchiostoma belcheri]